MVIEYFLEWVNGASVAKREQAAGALARSYLRSDLSNDDRENIEAAITTLLEDPAPCVRLELAKTFGAFPNAPRHIISSLATDSLEISIIPLSQSPVFHDSELCVFSREGKEKQQMAVASRPWLSPKLISSICLHSCLEANYVLLSNPETVLQVDDLHVLAERFGTDTAIRNYLSGRSDLPACTRLLLVNKLGDALGNLVSEKGWLSPKKSSHVVADACERASIIFASGVEDVSVREMVQQRIAENQLNVAYLLRAVCMGNISLVAHALSELSGIKFARVEAVLNKDRRSAFRAMYDRAGLPGTAFQVFETAISSWRQLLASNTEINRSRLPYLVTKQVLETCASGESELVDDLMILLRKLSTEAARESSRSRAIELSGQTSKTGLQVEVSATLSIQEDESDIVIEVDESVNAIQQTSINQEMLLPEPAPSIEIDGETIDDTVPAEANDNIEYAQSEETDILAQNGSGNEYIGSLLQEHLDTMYADIYDDREKQLERRIGRAA